MVDAGRLLPARAVLLSWEVEDSPEASAEESSVSVHTFDHDVCEMLGVRVVLGYRERLDVRHILERAAEQDPDALGDLDPRQALYVVSQPVLHPARRRSWARWRRKLFLGMERLSRGPADTLDLPRTRTVVIGREVEV
jgi:KUP system potassium uptake protein